VKYLMSRRFIKWAAFPPLMVNGTLVSSVKDALAIGSNIIESTAKEVVWLLPSEMLVLCFHYSIPEKSKMLIKNGGRVRGIFHIASPFVELARSLLANGESLRHIQHYEGAFFLVGDRRQSISSMYVNTEDLTLDSEIVAFWSEEATYAEYLLSIFEPIWDQGVDAEARMQELLKPVNPE